MWITAVATLIQFKQLLSVTLILLGDYNQIGDNKMDPGGIDFFSFHQISTTQEYSHGKEKDL